MTYYRKNITLPPELIEKMDEYNERNPYNKICLSQITQAALFHRLKEVSAI